MDHYNRREAADKMLSILAQRNCRSTLLCFQGTTENVISVRDLAARISPEGDSDETAVRLQHSTLPRLEDAGLVEHDSRSDTVRYHGDQRVEELLDAVTDCFPREAEVCEVGP